MKIYAIYDNVAQVYISIMSLMNDGVAKRNFYNMYNQDEQLKRHPEDYDLYELAIFDNTTGNIAQEQIKCICKAVEFTNN